ncbi:MAG: isoprenyl transferase [Chromatiales bacterium]|nr:isoprenyl transferase [Chromatiales bacterium]
MPASEVAVSTSGGRVPAHVAIIMDGNGRWAERRHLPRIAGHHAGSETVREIVRACVRKNIGVLTLFAFSSENWRRPEREVSLLLDLLLSSLRREVDELRRNGVRLRFIGDRSIFAATLRESMGEAERLTEPNTGLLLIIALNYGGRWDIAQAMRTIAREVQSGALSASKIDEQTIDDHLSLSGVPEPDLFIRTGGEQRISNFLLWNLAYTELYFTDVLWPDFNEQAFETALASFACRQRRFGRTGDQLEQVQGA